MSYEELLRECEEWKQRYHQEDECNKQLSIIVKKFIEEKLMSVFGAVWFTFPDNYKEQMINDEFFKYYPVETKKLKHERKI